MITKNTPLISAIIPVFQGEAFLAQAIQSILDQNYRPLEIIVVDDGSTDGSARIAKSFGKEVRYIFQNNQGVSSARNKGIQLALGEYLAFNDADDIWLPDKLSLQSRLLSTGSEMDIVLGHLQCICPQPSAPHRYSNCYQPFKIYHFGSSLIRREIFERVGEINEDMHYSEDIDWFLRAREASTVIHFHEQVVLHYRIHENNATRWKGKRESGFLLALKKSLVRRRKELPLRKTHND